MTAAPKSVIPSLRSGQALSGAAGDRAGPGEAQGFVDEGGECPEGARRRRHACPLCCKTTRKFTPESGYGVTVIVAMAKKVDWPLELFW